MVELFDWLTYITPFVTLLLGYFLKYYQDRDVKLREKERFREKLLSDYQTLYLRILKRENKNKNLSMEYGFEYIKFGAKIENRLNASEQDKTIILKSLDSLEDLNDEDSIAEEKHLEDLGKAIEILMTTEIHF